MAEIEFVVDTTGAPEPGTATVIRTNDQSYAQAVAAAVMLWQYRPARRDGEAVRQIVREKLTLQLVAAREGERPQPRRHTC